MSQFDGLLLERIDPHVALLRINRPPNNFIEFELVKAIADAYEELAAAKDVRAIVLAASGKHFCAGADFNATSESAVPPGQGIPAAATTRTYSEGARLVAAPLPVIAAVNGAAVGGGFGLACTADFRVGTASTRLVPNFSQLGVHHGFGLTVTLPRIVGAQRAAEILYAGRRIPGADAHRLGLLDRLVEEDGLEQRAIEFAREISAAAPLAVRAIRATLRKGLSERFLEAAQHEAREQARLGATADFREGIAAYAARREPEFRAD